MLRRAYFVFIFLFVSTVYGAPRSFEVDSKLFFKGNIIGSPRIQLKEGKKAKVIMNDQKNNREYNLEVVPTVGTNNRIHLQYSITVSEESNETISRGSIDFNQEKKGRISIDRGRIQLHLKVKDA